MGMNPSKTKTLSFSFIDNGILTKGPDMKSFFQFPSPLFQAGLPSSFILKNTYALQWSCQYQALYHEYIHNLSLFYNIRNQIVFVNNGPETW
jgi:hypothetical protein